LGIVKSCHHAVFDEAWYMQPTRPPAAQLLYDLGLEPDSPAAPPAIPVAPSRAPWPPSPPYPREMETPPSQPPCPPPASHFGWSHLVWCTCRAGEIARHVQERYGCGGCPGILDWP
jgi:hypothetical protein